MTDVGMVMDEDWFRRPDPGIEDRELLEQILENTHKILHNQNNEKEEIMTEANATQADIDALTTQVTTDDANVQAAVEALQAEIATLQGQGVDVTGLQSAVAKLTTDADSDNPTPAPAPVVNPTPAS